MGPWTHWLIIGIGLWVLVAVPVALLVGAVISRGQQPRPSERDD